MASCYVWRACSTAPNTPSAGISEQQRQRIRFGLPKRVPYRGELSTGVMLGALVASAHRSSRGSFAKHVVRHNPVVRAASRARSSSSGAPEVLKTHRHYEGTLFKCQHTAETLGGLKANFSVYVPDAPRPSKTLPYPKGTDEFPVLIYLSGLTCTDENVITKANAQEHCAINGIIFVAPDTSPRGAGIPGEDASFDFGLGAGYYLNATQKPWSAHYNMWDYVQWELPALLHNYFPTKQSDAVSIMGHSMGGMGALALALRNPEAYQSVSVLAPIAHPTALPAGTKPDVRRAFERYLGPDEETWKRYDPVELAKTYDIAVHGPPPPMLIDQGAEDEFFAKGVLQPYRFFETCQAKGLPADLRMRAGYDHSYFYVSSVIEEHIDFHAKHLE